MAISYTNVFGFIGKYIKAANNSLGWLSTLTTDQTALTSGNSFADGTDYDVHTYVVQSLVDSQRSAIVGYCSQIATQCQSILTNRDGIIQELGLGDNTQFQTVMNSFMNAMVTAGESCEASVVTVGSATRTVTNATAGYGYGDKGLDGVTAPIAGGRAYDHYVTADSQLAVPSENVTITCVQDSDSLGGTPGSEQWQIMGEPTFGTQFGWLSEGSGSGPRMNTLSRRNNLITNGDMETWTSATVIGTWTYATGAASTNYNREDTEKYIGTYSLKVTGTGAVATLTVNQAAPTSLIVNKRYCVGAWIKGNAGTVAGDMSILFTGTGYTAGSTEKITLNTTALQSTSWTHYKFFVNIPSNIPSDFKIAINLNSSFNGTVYIDDLVMGVPTYHGGICYAIFEGAGKFLKDDTFVFANTNDDAGAFNKFFRRAFKLQVPTSGSPTRADSLTT